MSRIKSSSRIQIIISVIFMGVLYAFSYIQKSGVPGTIFNELQHDFRMSAEQVTILSAIFLVIYAFMQFIIGGLIDRFGPNRVILAGGILLSAGSLLFPLSGNIPVLYFSRVLIGFGSSVMYLSIVKELDIRFSDRHFSSLLSIMILFGYSGGLLATRPLEMASASFGWRESLLFAGIACCIATLGAAFCFRGTPGKPSVQKSSAVMAALRNVARSKWTYLTTYTCAITFSVFFVFQSVIGKKMLEDCCGMSSASAATILFVMMLTSMITSVLSGFISAAMGNRRKPVMIAVSVISIAGSILGIVMIGGNSALAWPFALLIGAGSAGAPVFAASVKELNLPDFAATSVGLMNGSVYTGVTIGAWLCGRVMDAFGGTKAVGNSIIHYPLEAYRLIFIILLVMGISCVAVAFFTKETNGRNVYAGD